MPDVTAPDHEIAHTESRDRQNEILVESAGGIIGGAAWGLGAGITLAIMATPVGWVGALLIGTLLGIAWFSFLIYANLTI